MDPDRAALDPAAAGAEPAPGGVDRFARDHLPDPADLPEFLFELPELQFPPRLNCVTAL